MQATLRGLRQVFVVLALVAGGASADEEPVRVRFVTGGGTYDNSIFRVMDNLDGVESAHFPSDVEALAEGFESTTDVLVFYNVSRALADGPRGRLEGFVEGGGGVVVLHHALASYGGWPWWWREVTGGRYLLAPEAGLPPSGYRQGESIVASPVGDHPITEPLDGLPIHIYDETYRDLWLSDRMEILLRTGLSTSDGPLLWIGPFPSRRVVVFQPGHASSAHWNLAFRALLRQSILWAAGKLDPEG